MTKNPATEQSSGDFYGELLDSALAIPGLKTDQRLIIDNILSGETYYRKSSLPDPLSDLSFYLSVFDSGSTGFAYHSGQPQRGKMILDIINRNALEILSEPNELDLPLRISLLDAVYGVYNQIKENKPDAVVSHAGSYEEKADFRAQLVTSQLESGSRVLLVGLVTHFVRDMLLRDMKVTVSDLSPELEGVRVYGVPVVNSGNAWTLDNLSSCDAAVVTGASIATNTIDSIFATAAASKTDLHFYLETGNNFGSELIRRGAASVIAEKFPFYDLPGEAKFEIYTP